MAEVGNETKLVLKLASERMAHNPNLKDGIEWMTLRGNYPKKVSLPEAFERGYKTAVVAYETTVANIVVNLETK